MSAARCRCSCCKERRTTTIFEPVSDLLTGELCALGTAVDYRVFAGQGHNDSTAKHMPEILAWTAARFAGEPAASTCPEKSTERRLRGAALRSAPRRTDYT